MAAPSLPINESFNSVTIGAIAEVLFLNVSCVVGLVVPIPTLVVPVGMLNTVTSASF